MKLQPGTGARHQKLDTLLSGLLYCGQCGEPMGASFTSRHGRRHMYYVCRSGKKRQPRCRQKPIGTSDLESSLFEKLEPILGAANPSTLMLEQSVERVTYDSNIREVSVTLRDGGRFQYLLPVANRPGVRHTSEQQVEQGRVARVSRLMALAIKFQRLVEGGAVRNYAELAALGHVTRPRLCQIIMLANLAPTIQEALLFLPKTLRGPDSVLSEQVQRRKLEVDRQIDAEPEERFDQRVAIVEVVEAMARAYRGHACQSDCVEHSDEQMLRRMGRDPVAWQKEDEDHRGEKRIR
ncbi:MAG: zinc ribbon domain-containing protein [Bryobacteraceae bacterium]